MIAREDMVKAQRSRQAFARKVDRKSWDEFWAAAKSRTVIHPKRKR